MRALIRLTAAICGLLLAGEASAGTTLQFMVPSSATGDANRLFFELAQDFQQRSPDITVELVNLSNYDEVTNRVIHDTAAGHSAGLFVAELSSTLELQAAGAIQPIDDAMGAQFPAFKAALLPGFLGNSGDGVRFLSAPYFRSMPIAFYNLDALTAAGLPVDALPASWGEFETLLEQLAAKTGRPPFALAGDWYDWLFEALAATTGNGLKSDKIGHGLVLNSPDSVATLGFLKRLRQKGLMVRSPSWKGTINAFAIGAFPVVFYSSGGASVVEKAAHFSWTTHFLPRHATNNVPVGGGNLFLSAHMRPDEEAAALRFMGYLYSPAAQAKLSQATGYFPVTRAAFDEPAMVKRYGGSDAFGRMHANLTNATAKLMPRNNLKVRAIVKAAIDRSLDDDVPPEQSLDRAQQEGAELP